jgi:glucose/mannose-6-phosphate isomerase
MKMKSLDEPRAYKELDRSNMLGRIEELPRECLRAWDNAMGLELPPYYAQKVHGMMILGMGGSAIGGDLVRTLVEGQSRVPISVNRGYDLPAFVNEDTLVIGSSYSGNTEETLAAFRSAREREALLIAITTGGQLKQEAEEAGIPILIIDYQAQPRAALAYSFIPLMSVLWKLSLIPDPSGQIREAVQVMEVLQEEIGPQVPAASNPAKSLSEEAQGRLLDVYGGGHLAEVARRWKTQVNENGKAWAIFEEMPELNHNSVVGYPYPAELVDKIMVIFLQSSANHTRVLRRFEVTGSILDRNQIAHKVVWARGKSLLAQALSTILFGDYVSYYLAMLYGVDPTPVEAISYLKEELAKA